MHKLKSLIAAAAVALVPALAQAAWVETWNPADVYMSGGSFISHTFNLTTPEGFRPGIDTITGFDLAVGFRDDSTTDGSERARVFINGISQTFFPFEVETGTETFGTTFFGLLSLNFTGQLGLSLLGTSGDFYFTQATLTARGHTGSVPEPSTGSLALLGLGLLGAGIGLRRRQTS